MLIIAQGDLFEYVKENAIIVHGVNAQGKMASGFAKTIRDKYPGAFKAYMDAHKLEGLTVGDTITYHSRSDNIIILNAVTQEYYGYDDKVYVNYFALEWAMGVCLEIAGHLKLPIHFPFIGTGLAGGDKQKVLDIFTKVFDDTDVVATLWILKENK